MIFPCRNAVTECPANPSVLIGYNAAGGDAPDFIGLSWGPLFPPPLGWAFGNPLCFQGYTSTISQQDADTNAQIAATDCAEAQWTPPPDVVFTPPQDASEIDAPVPPLV